jgi:catechol 2,3-dioxygenase
VPAVVGHVHLQVGDIEQAKRFYVGVLGFDVTAELGGTALFVSAVDGGRALRVEDPWRTRLAIAPEIGG